MKDDITDAGRNLVRQWEAAQKHVEFIQCDMARAESVAQNAAFILGEWMCPKDAKVGETFHIWCAGGMIAATKRDTSYHVIWRERPTK